MWGALLPSNQKIGPLPKAQSEKVVQTETPAACRAVDICHIQPPFLAGAVLRRLFRSQRLIAQVC